MPVVVSAASTAGRPTTLISISAAVSSLMEIILVATSRTEIRVPAGSCSSTEKGVLTWGVMVSG